MTASATTLRHEHDALLRARDVVVSALALILVVVLIIPTFGAG